MKSIPSSSLFIAALGCSCSVWCDREVPELPSYDEVIVEYLNRARVPITGANSKIVGWRLDGGPSIDTGYSWDELLSMALDGPLPPDPWGQAIEWRWIGPGKYILLIAVGVDGKAMTGDDVCVIEPWI